MDFSLLLFIIFFLSSSFYLISPFLSLHLHHNHPCSSSSSVYLIILIGIPLHHCNCSHQYSFYVFCLLIHPLFIHLLILKKYFACQMPSKRAKYLPKIPFFMRYSESYLIGGCLICGAYQQRNKERKVGTFQIMPWCEGCLISGCALVKLDCTWTFFGFNTNCLKKDTMFSFKK